MAKGQQRSNKEMKKPKKQKQPVTVPGAFIKKPQSGEPIKTNPETGSRPREKPGSPVDRGAAAPRAA